MLSFGAFRSACATFDSSSWRLPGSARGEGQLRPIATPWWGAPALQLHRGRGGWPGSPLPRGEGPRSRPPPDRLTSLVRVRVVRLNSKSADLPAKIDRLIITTPRRRPPTSVRENTTTPGAGMGAPRRLAALSAQLCPGSSTTCCPVSAAPRPLYIDEVPFQLSEEQKYEFVSRATAPPAASVDPWMPCDAPL
jgi:hypothetical protein